MDVAGEFCDHVKQNLAYPHEISQRDVSQVFQGVAKPVFQFLLNHTKSYQDSKTIRANILLNQTNDTNKNRPNDASNSQKILNQVTSNQEIILKLQSEINLKRARRSILKAYEYKILKIQANFDQLKNNLENLKKIRNRPKSESINSQLISQLADRLLYLSTQKSKPLDIPVNAIKGILESLGLSFDASSLFAYLIRENTDAHQSIENTVNNFHPEIEMKSLGVNLKRVGEYFQVEDIDTSLIIDKLSAKVSRERDITWDAFNDCENMLNYTKELRKNFSALFERKEIYSSSKLKDFHKLEIELRSKKGQVNAMQTSIRELIQKKEDLSQKIMLLQRQQQKGKSDKTSISLQVATIVERNSSLRRDLGKYKLRIDEFMQNHILAIRNEVPELLKPLLTSISREGTEFSKIQHLLLPLNIPHRLRPEQCLSQPMRSPVTHKQLRRVFEALYVGLHQSEHCLIDQIRLKTVCPDIIEKTVPKSLMLKEDDKEKRDRLRMIDVKTKDEDKWLSELELYTLNMWKEQPGQHCIPWKRDQTGLNISEALELWLYKQSY